MYTAIAGILLSLVLMLFNARISVAEIWVCSQPNGSTLYTDGPQEAGCQKFEPVSELTYLPPRIWTSPPTPEVADENQELDQPEEQIASIEDEQTVASSNARESYNFRENSFWSSEENRIYTWVYTYSPGFYGIRPLRPRHLRNFEARPRTKHETHHRVPLFRQSVPRSLAQSVPPILTEPRHFRENPVRAGGPTARAQSGSLASSRHVPGGSVGTTAVVAPAPSSGFSPRMKR
jgi:hypothetical protein